MKYLKAYQIFESVNLPCINESFWPFKKKEKKEIEKVISPNGGDFYAVKNGRDYEITSDKRPFDTYFLEKTGKTFVLHYYVIPGPSPIREKYIRFSSVESAIDYVNKQND